MSHVHGPQEGGAVRGLSLSVYVHHAFCPFGGAAGLQGHVCASRSKLRVALPPPVVQLHLAWVSCLRPEET